MHKIEVKYVVISGAWFYWYKLFNFSVLTRFPSQCLYIHLMMKVT